MPELPEVETVVRGLKASIANEVIKTLELSNKSFRIPYPKDFIAQITGAKVKDIHRRAKYIIIELNNAKSIIIHLGMSGKVLVGDKLVAKNHDHARFSFVSGQQLVFNDPRRFGLITLVNSHELDKHILLANLGIEPLTDALNAKELQKLVASCKLAIKLFLMDGTKIVGLGNIYASEILFRSNVDPRKPANCLNTDECKEICRNIKAVLNEAIASGGSTLRDYVQSSGSMGYFQHKFLVYGKENQPCVSCTTPIQKISMGGRSTFFCPNCQQ